MPVEITNSIGMKLVLIPPGEFQMGSPKELIEEELKRLGTEDWYRDHLPDEGPQHRVRITGPFYLGLYHVTQEEYRRVTGRNPSWYSTSGLERAKVAGQDTTRFPVENVSWNDAMEFCKKLSRLREEKADGRAYRLPSEANWEYACRAGSKTKWSFGDTEDQLGEYGWFTGNSCGQPHSVGQLKSNAFGLCDMYGNVRELCSDWYYDRYYAISPVDDPSGVDSGAQRVIRGGGWNFAPAYVCRSAVRGSVGPWFRDGGIGFRVSIIVGGKSGEPAPAPSIEDTVQEATVAPQADDPDRRAAEMVLLRGGKLSIVTGNPERGLGVSVAKDLPAATFWVESISLSNTSVVDTDLERLSSLPRLAALEMYETKITDAGVGHLHNLPKLVCLWLAGTSVTDKGLESIANLQLLNNLELPGKITNAGFVQVARLKKMWMLRANGTQVTDDGLQSLKGLVDLRYIELKDTGISDRGLAYLEGLSLTDLVLLRTKVTAAGVARLQAALPNCRIAVDPAIQAELDKMPKISPTGTQPSPFIGPDGKWQIPPGGPSPATAPFDTKQAKEHQEAWAKHVGVPVEITNSIGMKLVLIPPGEFDMGSPKELVEEEMKRPDNDQYYKERLPSEGPQHRVRITRPFYLGTYLVTQQEYQRVMGTNPSEFSATGNGKDKVAGQDTKCFPVEMVSWDDAVEFCRKLSNLPEEKAAGRWYRLPSETQWEYACRAGIAGRYSFSLGGKAVPKEYDERGLFDYGWFNGNAGGTSHPVGLKRPNAWGLYDMHGNVWQWCQDWHADDYYEKSPTDDPAGPLGGSSRVGRGSSWDFPAWRCRLAFRNSDGPGSCFHDLGFRISQALAENAPKPLPAVESADRTAAEMVLLRGGSLQIVTGNPERRIVVSVAKDLPASTFWIEHISLGYRPVMDTDLECLSSLPRLGGVEIYHTKITDTGVAHLCNLPKLVCLWLAGTSVTDKGLESIANLQLLNNLNLPEKTTNAGFVQVGRLKKMWMLSANGTQVTDDGLQSLKGLADLRFLELNDTGVGDQGLVYLEGLSLTDLALLRTKVTAAGVAKLQAALPNCKINVDPAIQAELDKMKAQALPPEKLAAPVKPQMQNMQRQISPAPVNVPPAAQQIQK